jgi:hypothetical protein
MTANVVRVNSDYKIQSVPGGKIILDTGLGPSGGYGKVTVLGDLDVKGAATVITSNVVSIQDLIITLNVGETGNGVTGSIEDPYISGIAVDRGPRSPANPLGNARWVWDETQTWLSPTAGPRAGLWVSKTTYGGLNGIQTNSITTGEYNEDLYLLSKGTGRISVTGTVNYEQQILDYANGLVSLDDDYIPNLKAVSDKIDYAIINNTINSIRGGDSNVSVFDDNITEKLISYNTIGSSNIVTFNHFPVPNSTLKIDTASSITITNCINTELNGTWPIITALPGSFYFVIQISSPHSYADVPVSGNIFKTGFNSNVEITVNETVVTTVYQDHTEMYDLSISNSTITTVNDDVDITITATGTGTIVLNSDQDILVNNSITLDGVATLTHQTAPSPETDKTKIYADTHGQGDTGLFFVNNEKSGEFISKKKAIAFSILM